MKKEFIIIGALGATAFLIASHITWYTMISREQKLGTPTLIQGIQSYGNSTKECTTQVDCQILSHQQSITDMLRIGNIQYVGKTLTQKSIQGVSEWLEIISYSSPFWEFPYVFGQLIIPIDPQAEYDTGLKNTSWQQAIHLGEKGIAQLCDEKKIQSIKKLTVSQVEQKMQIKEKETIMNPCPSSLLPLSIGFNAFFYTKQIEKSLLFYKIALAQTDVPKRISAIAQSLESQSSPILTQILLEYENYLNKYKRPQIEEEAIYTSKNTLKKLLNEHFQFIFDQQCPSKNEECISIIKKNFISSCENSIENIPLDSKPRFTTKGILCTIAATP